MKTGRAAKNRAARHRRETRARWVAAVKRYAWRFTAFWCWLHIIVLPTPAKTLLARGEAHLAARAYEILIGVGFAPSNQHLLPVVSQLFWVLCITQFSWSRLVGLFIYISVFPISFPFMVGSSNLRKQYEAAKREQAQSKEIGLINPAFSLNSFLVASSLAWFTLYGGSTSRLPLIVALLLTGALFLARVYSAFMYTTMFDADKGFIARVAQAPLGLLRQLGKQVSTGRIKNDEQLLASIKMQSRILRWLRRFSVYLHGREGKRRAALIVLFQYMGNLAILSILTVFFWALAIKLSKSPLPISFYNALLASASHVIPGVPDAEGIKVSLGVHAGISLTAFAIFVLYAGPVASMFPILQERYIKQVQEHYQTLRVWRGLLYRLNDAVMRLYAQKDAKPLTPIGELEAADELQLIEANSSPTSLEPTNPDDPAAPSPMFAPK